MVFVTIITGSKYFKTLLSGVNIVCCPSVVLRRECYEELLVLTLLIIKKNSVGKKSVNILDEMS